MILLLLDVRIYLILFVFLLPLNLLSQGKDSTAYTLYQKRVVLYADLGFNSAPFSLKDNYNLGVKKIKYKNNIRAVLGIGLAYKWFAFRLGLPIPGQIKSISRFGKTNYYDLGVKFSVKQIFIDIDFRYYNGYVIKGEYKWNDKLNELNPNGIYPSITSFSTSINSWYFNSKNLNMRAVFGKVGHYEKPIHTWYIKSSVNLFGISNGVSSIVPAELSDSTDRQKTSSIVAFDFGAIPGYTYVNRVNNWQFALFGGLGGVVQVQSYKKQDGESKGALGLAPRIDLRFIGGYSKPKYFILLATDFDIKSLKIERLSYNQSFYNIRLITGVRLLKRKNKKGI